jgi:hypothetical protein
MAVAVIASILVPLFKSTRPRWACVTFLKPSIVITLAPSAAAQHSPAKGIPSP